MADHLQDHMVDAAPEAEPSPPTGDRIEGLYVWQPGPGHCAAIVSIASAAPREAAACMALLAPIHELSHVAVETEAAGGLAALRRPRWRASPR